MTEAEWLDAQDPRLMLWHLDTPSLFRTLMRWAGLANQGRLNRKLRLFACACCRRIWDLLPDDVSRGRVDVAEKVADGLGGDKDLRAACEPCAYDFVLDPEIFHLANLAAMAAVYAAFRNPHQAASWASDSAILAVANDQRSTEAAEAVLQAALLRDIVGNPFRPFPAVHPAARYGNTVRQIARAIYEGRRFDDLPILADALDDAGCPDAALTRHCRERAIHARGCWVVDYLLGL